MSGIVGMVNLDGAPVDRQLLQRLTDSLSFRGPDAQEIWVHGQAGLGHTLLRTTLESESERQPWTVESEVWITADARIDGRAELIAKLAGRGCRDLVEAPDVQLILHSYLAWGEDCLRHLLGDFAFAIWDGRKKQLFCARDHFGVKPFYYAHLGNCLIFSNTINCLREHPQISDRLNEMAIADFLLFYENQDESTTTFADIMRLPPAHCFTWRQGNFGLSCYWKLPRIEEPLRYPHPQDYVEHFKALLTEAVSDRLRSPRVSVFMSGGLDSTLVSAVAKKLLPQEAGPIDLQAYTVIFDRLIPDNERAYANLAAEFLNIPIHFFLGDDYQLYEGFADHNCPPEPNHDPRWASWQALISLAESHSRIILTGDGGDPFLSPSHSYILKSFKELHWGRLALEIARSVFQYRRLPPVGLRTAMSKWLKVGDLPDFPSWLNPEFSARLNLKSRWRNYFWGKPQAMNTLRDEVYQGLSKPRWANCFERDFDPGGTGAPVEFRHPFFDVRLAIYLLQIPPLPWCMDKMLLRQAGCGLLPEAVRQRPKTTLTASPVYALIKDSPNFLPQVFSPGQELAPYVDLTTYLAFTGTEQSETAVNNLCPVTLNIWLQCQRQKRS